MAKTTAPNLSIGSAGQVGKTLVSAKWRGVSYVRKYVVPANPNTAAQQSTRSVFSFLSDVWKILNAAAQAPWTAYAKGMPLTNRNAYIQANLPELRGKANLHGFVGSPGSGGGLAAEAVAPTGGAGSVTVALTAPTLPTGWTITAAHAVAIKDQDTTASPWTQVPATVYGTDATAPYSIPLTVAAGTYDVAAWFEYKKADGSTAYGPSTTVQGTAT